MLKIFSNYGNANQNHSTYHFILIRMTITKKLKIISVSKNVEKLKPLYIAGGSVK